MVVEFQAGKADRLDRILRESGLKGSEWVSRQSWDWLLENGCVWVNGRRAVKAGAALSPGDQIRVEFPGDLGLLPAPQAAFLAWASPDHSLAAFHKPAGLATISLHPWDQSSFANQIAAFNVREKWVPDFAALAPTPSLEGGVLQRLDRDTSGLVLAAFTSERKAQFRDLFARSAIEKTYLALISDPPVGLEGEHTFWLNISGGAIVKAHSAPPQGKAEEVRLSVEVCKSSSLGSLLRIRTCHGSRHIVRSSLAALGTPLLGDKTYGGSSIVEFHQLHASSIRLLEGSALPEFPPTLESDPPQTFVDSRKLLGLH